MTEIKAIFSRARHGCHVLQYIVSWYVSSSQGAGIQTGFVDRILVLLTLVHIEVDAVGVQGYVQEMAANILRSVSSALMLCLGSRWSRKR